MAPGTTISRKGVAAARAPRFVFRYILLALLFAVAVFFQIGSTRAILRYVPTHVPAFFPGVATASLEYVDSKASAAGLRKGDILVAINGRPYTGRIVFWEEVSNVIAGRALVVTVRYPGANSQNRTILLPVTRGSGWKENKTILIAFFVLMPPIFIVLGFWVALARPNDLLAWLLLGLFLMFSQMLVGSFAREDWGPGLMTFTVGYTSLLAMLLPIFMFLFGYYFPEPMPFFRRQGLLWKWLPWIVVAPYAILGFGLVIVAVCDVNSYSSVAPLYRILRPVGLCADLYTYFLVSCFFGKNIVDAPERWC